MAQRVSAFALRSISTNWQNKPELLPLTSDIIKLSNYLDSEIKARTTACEEQHTALHYEELVCVTSAKLITFNKRRAGETEHIELEQYRRMLHVIGLANDEFSATLKPSEKKLCERMQVVSITGQESDTVANTRPEEGNGSHYRSTVENSYWCVVIKCVRVWSCMHIVCAFIQGEWLCEDVCCFCKVRETRNSYE